MTLQFTKLNKKKSENNKKLEDKKFKIFKIELIEVILIQHQAGLIEIEASVTAASAARSKGVGAGGYTKSDSNRDAARGRYDDGGRVYLYNRLK